MTMKKKTLLATLTITAILIFIVPGMQFVEITRANFIVYPIIPSPIISIQPLQEAYSSNNILVVFSVSYQTTWYGYPVEITTIGCNVDGLPRDFSPSQTAGPVSSGNTTVSTWNVKISELPRGNHNLQIWARIQTSVWLDSWEANGVNAGTNLGSSNAPFFVDVPAYYLSIISLEQNKTYYTNILPIEFETNVPSYGLINYSLDQQPSVTVNGATAMLTGLAEGNHSITAYTTDPFTNTIISSETTHFTIAKPQMPTLSPSPSSSLSPSSTQQPPTTDPTQKPSPTSDTKTENFTHIIIIVGLVALAVVAALSVYFKREGAGYEKQNTCGNNNPPISVGYLNNC
jgi:hypothetical protein